ncbi:alpha/beta hydrolase [Mycobacterium vicinigordonae]|uniref:Alpha/beta hydrolase n=1 Tax=Mycobacterium vicinigordonae TaxID=1719132 RepID=A0A7D6IQI8_9MYCO|nr:alpha/beta hydrolase [Mycobacterium vicinigordonae]QLL09560.1 alpha/beta hydrolase [Mycobacterium vicinigordonae]
MTTVDYAEIDPELRRIARILPKGYALHRGITLPRALMGLAGKIGAMRDVEVAQVDSHVSVRVHRPVSTRRPGPALLWIHGGGTVMGSAAQEDKYCRKLANSTDVTVVAVEHRLAPEHPYPVPVQDCYAALQWLARQPWVDPHRLAVGGASAGGGFTASVAQLACDRGEIALSLQLMVYPMLDDRTGASPDGKTRVMWSERDNQIAWGWYLGGADPAEAAPARRASLSGLAPAWIGVGTLDLFHRECLDYAQQLGKAGVPVQQEIIPGAFHAFDLLVPNAAVSQRFFASQCRAVRCALVGN